MRPLKVWRNFVFGCVSVFFSIFRFPRIVSYLSCHAYYISYLYVAHIAAVIAVEPKSPTSRAKLSHTVLNLNSSVCISICDSYLYLLFCYDSLTSSTLYLSLPITLCKQKVNSIWAKSSLLLYTYYDCI